jgi:hypothetical protein
LLACLGAIAGAPVAWIMAEPAQAIAEAAASKAADLADLLSQRSPGTRTQDLLTKHARVAAKVRTQPKHTATPEHPATPDLTALVDQLLPPVAPVEVALANLPPALETPPTLGDILGSTPGFTPPVTGGGGGGTQSPPTSEPREVVPPVSAVPEPGTWATMLLGFGLVAWRIRRRQPKARKLKRLPL